MPISEQARAVLNDPGRVREREAWLRTLTNLFEGKRDPYLDSRAFTLMGMAGRAPDPEMVYRDPEASVDACLEDLARQAAAAPAADRFAPLCVEYPIYGVHFIDRILGADVFFQDGQWYARCLETPVGTLRAPDLDADETWAMARRGARAFLSAGVTAPLFGMPTLSSALNTLVNIYGEGALTAMLAEPEAAAHDLRVINDLIIALHRWYRDALPARQLQAVISWCRTQPPGCGQLCGCTTQLVSAQLYAEMVAPLDDALLSAYPNGGMMHLCGRHTQHLEAFRGMASLRAVQLNDRAAWDLQAYFEGLREDQLLYVNPCPEMPVEEILRVTGGRRAVICQDMDAPRLGKGG